jgi:hypothetical protein
MAVIKIVPMPGAVGDKGDPGDTGARGPAGDTYVIPAEVPNSMLGASGNVAGMFSTSSDYFYFCIADYVDGSTPIWKRISWDSNSW